MFTIGQFSKICRVTTKTLRHYDEIDLLKPVRVDPLTQYRYYSAEQIDDFRRIALLKELGFSLDAVKRLLEQPFTTRELEAALCEQAHRIEGQVEECRRVLDRVNREIEYLRGGKNIMQTNQLGQPQIKELPAVRVASVRDRGAYSKIGELFFELAEFADRRKLTVTGPGIFIHHDPEYKPDDADLEVCLPVKGGVADGDGRVIIKEIPVCRAVCMLHIGPYDQVGGTYAAILKYIPENQLNITGLIPPG